MHELSYMIKLADLAIKEAKKNNASSVREITVEAGELTGVLPEYLSYYFPQVAKGTILEGAKLTAIKVPVTAKCNDCGNIYNPDKDNNYSCPVCKSINAAITGGRDVVLTGVVID